MLIIPFDVHNILLLCYLNPHLPGISYAGMLSKAKGQILRVAATLHVLFHIDTPLAIPSIIDDKAVKAAIDLVDVCIQQAAFLAGRGDVQEAIEELAKGYI